MESTSSRVNVSNSRQSSKQLLFDRRYGWVIDEWKDPAEEALDGGRGMFCILPLAKALVQKASQSDQDSRIMIVKINFAVISVKKGSENPELFSPQMLQSGLDDGVKSFMTFFKNIGSKGFILNKNSQSHASNSSSLSHTESNG